MKAFLSLHDARQWVFDNAHARVVVLWQGPIWSKPARPLTIDPWDYVPSTTVAITIPKGWKRG